MYTYKVVERALMLLHDIDAETRGAFRGRIQHLQRLGVTPSSPGKGKHIEYSYEDVAKWAFLLQLEEFGIDPTSAIHIMDKCWSKVSPHITPVMPDDPVLLIVDPGIIISKRKKVFSGVVQSSKWVPMGRGTIRALVVGLSYIGESLNAALIWAAEGKGPKPIIMESKP